MQEVITGIDCEGDEDMTLLADNGLPNVADLNARIDQNLARRLRVVTDYSDQELHDIAEYSVRLFPRDFALTQLETDDFRALCAYSQVTLKLPLQIRSHRKWIGPIIVRLKRLMLPLLRFQLKDTLKGIQEFHCRSVIRMARSVPVHKESSEASVSRE